MARSIEKIYSEIILAKEAKAELSALDSTSVTAIWRLWAYVTATAIFTIETMWDLFRAEIEGIIASQKPGSLIWYRQICLGFKLGVSLTNVNGRLGYPINDVMPLISQCSVKEAADGLVIKVAKDVNGQLEPLSVVELNSFSSFIAQMKYAGTPVRIVNAPANLLKMNISIYYDPLIIKQSGEQITDSKKIVEESILNHLKSLQFDGRLKRSSLVTAIMETKGVQDCQVYSLMQKYESYPYEEIELSHVPESGYFKIDPLFPLSTSINYYPHV
jgi:hypothetical protein